MGSFYNSKSYSNSEIQWQFLRACHFQEKYCVSTCRQTTRPFTKQKQKWVQLCVKTASLASLIKAFTYTCLFCRTVYMHQLIWSLCYDWLRCTESYAAIDQQKISAGTWNTSCSFTRASYTVFQGRGYILSIDRARPCSLFVKFEGLKPVTTSCRL